MVIMEDDIIEDEQICRMFLASKSKEASDEQLAVFMHRFNLDWDTVEIMPAFEEHCKLFSCREVKK